MPLWVKMKKASMEVETILVEFWVVERRRRLWATEVFSKYFCFSFQFFFPNIMPECNNIQSIGKHVHRVMKTPEKKTLKKTSKSKYVSRLWYTGPQWHDCPQCPIFFLIIYVFHLCLTGLGCLYLVMILFSVFSLLHNVHWIHWIKTKSKSSIVTRDTPHLTIIFDLVE